jgi:Transcriptional regulator, effector-binding domain/component
MEYKAEIRKIPEHIIYFSEYFVEDMNDFFHALAEKNFLQELSDKVMLENQEIQLTDPDYNVILYMNGEYRERNVQIEFCDAVTDFGKDTKEYRFRTVPAFTALNVLHKGPYKKLSEAYAFADQWMAENGYRKAGNPRNSTIDGCWNRDSEDDYLTEIQIPVEKTS